MVLEGRLVHIKSSRVYYARVVLFEVSHVPRQWPLDNYARVVLLCVSQCALELRARSFFCVQTGGHFGGSPEHVLGGVVWVLEKPFIYNAAGAFGCVTISPLEEANMQGEANIRPCVPRNVSKLGATGALLDTPLSKNRL